MNVLVGQSGGPTAVINASIYGVVRAWQAAGERGRVLGMRYGVEGALEERLVDLSALGETDLESLRITPSAALGACRYKLQEGDVDRLLALCRRHQVRYFLYAGGNDSADTAYRLWQHAQVANYELGVVSIPKTIDNDLPETDHCPGYGSIARFVAITTMESGLDTEATWRTHPIKLIEVMGRDAGWVAAAAGLGRTDERQAPHLLYLPERLFEIDTFLADVQRVYDRLGYCVIALSENLRGPDGRAVHLGEPLFVDAFGHGYFSGLVHHLASEITRRLGIRARYDKPGTIQRMSYLYSSETDRDDAEMVGRAAVRAVLAGETGKMVTIVRESDAPYRASAGLCPLTAVANRERRLPAEFLADAETGVTEAFRRYARPLLGAPLPTYLHLP